MCNPPFYSSPQEMANLSKEKAGAPNAVSLSWIARAEQEFFLYDPGMYGVRYRDDLRRRRRGWFRRSVGRGEHQIPRAMQVRQQTWKGTKSDQIYRWYTSMLGRMSSLIEIIELFRNRNVSSFLVIMKTTPRPSLADSQLCDYRVCPRSNQALGYRLELLRNEIAGRKFIPSCSSCIALTFLHTYSPYLVSHSINHMHWHLTCPYTPHGASPSDFQ